MTLLSEILVTANKGPIGLLLGQTFSHSHKKLVTLPQVVDFVLKYTILICNFLNIKRIKKYFYFQKSGNKILY